MMTNAYKRGSHLHRDPGVAERVLVTGGAGFVGSHLVDALIKQGREVHVLDDLSTGSLSNLAHIRDNKRLHLTVGSVLDAEAVRRSVSRVDFVYHLAASVGVAVVMQSPIHTIRCNVEGTENVLRAAQEFSAGVLVTSTSEVYGRSTGQHLCEDEDLPIRPPTSTRWGYACSKLMDEFLALSYWREHGLPVFVVRFFNIVGPRQSDRYGMVIPRFVSQALNDEPITVYGDGSQSRCFCFVEDAIPALLELPRRSEAVGEIYNLGSTEEISILELAHRVKWIAQSASEIRCIAYPAAYSEQFEDIPRRVPCIDKISALLDWCPSTSLNGILQRSVESHRQRVSTTKLRVE